MPNVAATTYLMDPTVSLNTTAGTVVTTYDITDQVSAVEIQLEASLLKRTTFGNTHQRYGRGLKGGTIKFEFYVEFENSGIFEMFATMWSTYERVGFSVSEAGGAAITGSFIMNQMPTFAGSVDEYNVASLTFTIDGVVTITERT